MEVKHTVTKSLRTTVRNGLELLAITLVFLLPLAVTAFALIDTELSFWETVIFGVVGTLVWWGLCWFAFWFKIEYLYE